MDLGNPQLVTKVAQLCVDAHTSVEAAAGRFYQELRRRYYVTPKMFLDLVSLYDSLLRSKQAELEGARARLLCGIQKLQETNAAVDVMTQQLNDLQPLLAEKTGTTQKLLEQVCEGPPGCLACRSHSHEACMTRSDMDAHTSHTLLRLTIWHCGMAAVISSIFRMLDVASTTAGCQRLLICSPPCLRRWPKSKRRQLLLLR
jgi:hypothetical protein